VRGLLRDGQAQFYGIPYAAPPLGELRWKAPAPVRAWRGVKETIAFGDSCMQSYDFGPMSEDCLTLNIWAEWPSTGPKPVMVWFHGGGDSSGGTNSIGFLGDSLAKRGAVVVTVNYRLGPFGFLALPELSAETPHKGSGNYGLMDHIASLKWVRDNIGQFGGDPNNVTIFGQSAGAANVQRLMVSPLSKGLFHRAIAQSGALRRNDPTLAVMEQQCSELIARLRLPAQNRLAALRRASAQSILQAFQNTEGRCRPINLDNYLLPEQGFKVWAEGRQHPVPMMGGNAARESYDEMELAELKADIAEKYGDLAARAYELYGLNGTTLPPPHPLYGYAWQQWGADHHNRCRVAWQGLQHEGVAVYFQYEFQRELPGRQALGNMHSNDVPSVFGLVFNPRYERSFSAADKSTAEQMQRYWVNFAKNGHPNGEGLPLWQKFDDGGRDYMEFGANGAVPKQSLRGQFCRLFLQAENARPTYAHPERSDTW
jgi:para-nitrobenzyl esterase